jgi:hypothetical protein
MNPRRPLLLLAAAISPAVLFFLGGCTKTDDSNSKAQDAKDAATNAVAEVKTTASDSWDSIKDYTYEKRVEFSAGVDRISKDMDEKYDAMKAKFAGVPDAAAKDRDSAMKEYDIARADLKAKLADLRDATADTWASAKAKVDEAWKKVQAAWDKVTKSGAAA